MKCYKSNYKRINFLRYEVVAQEYTSRVHDEDVLKGNSAILKCVIPSFVADFVIVQSWVDGEGKVYYPSNAYGNGSDVISPSSFLPSSFPLPP